MVSAVRRGQSRRHVARSFGVSLSSVQYWLERARGRRLSRVNWSDRARGPQQAPKRTPRQMEDLILETRQQLRERSPLGEYGAQAVFDHLWEQGTWSVPSLRTINRIFDRRGVLDHHRAPRRKAPSLGWYLPEVVQARAELDQFDLVEGLKIKHGPMVEVLNGVSLHGGLVASWPMEASFSAVKVVECLVEHWQRWGLPGYAQFDNDTLFQASHQHRDVISRVMRLCLSLGVVPVFAPVREQGFQAAIESYNAKWQQKVWGRFEHQSLEELQEHSTRYVQAHHNKRLPRQEAAPERGAFPEAWSLDLQAHPADYPKARLVYVRRTNPEGQVMLLGRRFEVDPNWTSRLVRCEVLLGQGVIGFHQLRRRAPQEQPLLREYSYHLPRRPFQA